MPRLAFENYGISNPSRSKFEQIATMMKDDGAPVSPKIPTMDVTDDSEILVLLSVQNRRYSRAMDKRRCGSFSNISDGYLELRLVRSIQARFLEPLKE